MKRLIPILLLLTTLSASAQSLWQESKYGMTLAQVQTKFPDASPPADPETIYGGAAELLRITDVEMVGHKFIASFFFKDERLVQVMLILEEKNGTAAKQVFDSLSEEFKARYGAEVLKEKKSGTMTAYRSKWMHEETSIILYFNVMEPHEPILNIVYQVRPASEQ